MKWNPKNVKWYIQKGYKYHKGDIGKEFDVKVSDLPDNSFVIVYVLCDYCHKAITPKKYVDYIEENKKGTIHTDCCNNTKCMKLKRAESNEFKYGTTNQFQREKVKEDIRQCCFERYNVLNFAQVDECKEKHRQTCLRTLGVEYNSQTDEWLEKVKNTSMKHWGTEFPFQSEIVKEKIKQSNIDKYGVPYTMQSEEIRSKFNKSLYKNGTAPCSKQQKYLWELLGGELNYSNNTPNLDVAFPEEKIYIEYDGGGHDLEVKLGILTLKEFTQKMIKRESYLRRRGWKIIRITSAQDLLPKDNIIIDLVKKAKEYLQTTNHTWFEINIDNKLIRCKQYSLDYNLGKLRRIR